MTIDYKRGQNYNQDRIMRILPENLIQRVVVEPVKAILEEPVMRAVIGGVLMETGMAHEDSPFSYPLRIVGFLMLLTAFTGIRPSTRLG